MNTTDPQDEIFPIVNQNDEVIGKITRKEANSNPNIIHRDAGVIVYNSKGEILIQRRSETKDTFPGCLDISVGGHVDYGDEYLETAVRETAEELGLHIDKADLKLLGKTLIIMPWEQEFWQIYSYVLPGDFELKSNGEVTEAKFMSISEIEASLQKDKWSEKAKQNLNEFVLKRP